MEFVAISERRPGAKWQGMFAQSWPRYRGWYLSEGLGSRPTPEQSRAALGVHMPELLPVYDGMCELVGDDPVARRALSLYLCPPVFAGCSVALAPGDEPVMVRSYDFNPEFFEGTVLLSQWLEQDVIATSEAWIGSLDGVNASGLSAAMTFGGRPVHGADGFLTPILVRYVLETCETTAQAVSRLQRLPAQTASNVMLLDRSGDHSVVYLAPDRAAEVRQVPITTNHQFVLEWPEGNRFSETAERFATLERMREAQADLPTLIAAFHQEPLYRTAYGQGLGTLYTAVIHPASGTVAYHWPGEPAWTLAIGEFVEGARQIAIPVNAGPPPS